jgi:hypothetical protein
MVAVRITQTVFLFLDQIIEILFMFVSLDLKSTLHKIFFAVWFEYEGKSWAGVTANVHQALQYSCNTCEENWT